MPFEAILHEIEQLHDISERLATLADRHPLMSEALMAVSGSVRDTATILGVLIATRMTGPVSLNMAT